MDNPDFLVRGAQLAVSIMTFVVVLVGLSTTRKHFRIIRSISYIERFNSDNGIRLRKRVDDWLKTEDDEVKLKEFLEDSDLRIEVLAFMNLFQELGAAYNRNILNKEDIQELFDFLVPYYWERLQFLIEHYRETSGDPKVYRKFKLINDEIARRRV